MLLGLHGTTSPSQIFAIKMACRPQHSGPIIGNFSVLDNQVSQADMNIRSASLSYLFLTIISIVAMFSKVVLV